MADKVKVAENDPVREKLIELIQSAVNGCATYWAGLIADHLIAHGVTVQEWIPVTERLPDINGKYLVARKEGGIYSISVRKFRKEVPCWYTGYCGHWERRTNGITHWMPLPEPPKGE